MSYAPIQGGSSLVLNFNVSSQQPKEVLVVGNGRLAALRAFACLEADFSVCLAHYPDTVLDPELDFRLQQKQIRSIPLAQDEQLCEWIQKQVSSLAFVLVTDTLSLHEKRSQESSKRISQVCRSLRIPVSIADQPRLSDFTFPSTHRFSLVDEPEKKSSLQLSISTSSSACRLSTRIKRQAVAALPKEVGQAVDRISQARASLKQGVSHHSFDGEFEEEQSTSTNINRPVAQRSRSAADASFTQLDTQARLRFIAQMCKRPASWVSTGDWLNSQCSRILANPKAGSFVAVRPGPSP